jgi:hypothetical protein
MTGTEIYKRTPVYDQAARDIRLLAPHWKLLLAYDGQRSLAEVATSVDVPFAEAVPLTLQFLGEGWIEEQPITLDQYLKRVGAKDVASIGAAVPAAEVLHQPNSLPASPAPAVTPLPPPPTPSPKPPSPVIVPPVAAPLAGPALSPPPLPPSIVPEKRTEAVPVPTPTVAASPVTPGRPMRLNAIVDFITSLVGNISHGQLLVYRVFLRVPPELLLAEDIASVHLVNDTSLVRTEKLQNAISDAVQAVAKRPLPSSVFAAA